MNGNIFDRVHATRMDFARIYHQNNGEADFSCELKDFNWFSTFSGLLKPTASCLSWKWILIIPTVSAHWRKSNERIFYPCITCNNCYFNPINIILYQQISICLTWYLPDFPFCVSKWRRMVGVWVCVCMAVCTLHKSDGTWKTPLKFSKLHKF